MSTPPLAAVPASRLSPGLLLGLGLGLYFALQVLRRVLSGPGLELDEAELVVMARQWHLGYGPQMPLFNWVQAGSFALFGASVPVLAATKFATLWVGFMAFYAAVAGLGGDRRAAACATMGLFLLPDVSWEAQRTLSHSVALIAMCGLFLWALSGVLRRGRWVDYIALGLALGLGGLSKANFWALPPAIALALVVLRPWPVEFVELRRRGLALAALIAALILAPPLFWIATHPQRAFASAGKLYRGTEEVAQSPVLSGLLTGGEAILGALALVALIAVVLRGRYASERRATEPASERLRWTTRLLGLSALLGLLGMVGGMALAGATHISPRWLLPLSMPAGLALILWARVARADRLIMALGGAVAVIVLLGLGVMRGVLPARKSMAAPELAARITAIAQEAGAPVLGGQQWVVGNLWLYAPDLPVDPLLRAPCDLAPGTRGLIVEESSRVPAQGASDPDNDCAAQEVGRWDVPFANRRDGAQDSAVTARLMARP